MAANNLKGKKIACFVALPHHTRFIFPVADRAERLGAKIVYFTTQSDFPFERDLMKKSKECKLLQSYSSADTREKIAHTASAFFGLWSPRLFKWDGMKHWPLVLQSILLTDGFEEYFCLEEFIRVERPDMFIALHERNRWGKLIGHLSSKYGIPYITFQEGDYYEDRISFSGHTEYTTALLLWGDETKKRLARLKATPQKFVMVGNTHLATVKDTYFTEEKIAKTKKDLNIPPDKKVVLFLMGIQWGIIKDPAIWEELLGGIGDDVIKIFKWHPKVSYESYKTNAEELFKNKFPSSIVLQNYDSYSLLAISDYCITLGKTTLAVEALSFGKPLFSLPGRDGEPDHYAQWGVSQPLWPPGNYEPLYKTIKDGVPDKVQRRVEDFLQKEFFYKNNTVAIDRTIEVIKHIFECRQDKAQGKEQRAKSKNPMPYALCPMQKGRVSFVIPSSNDAEALLSTLTSLSQNVKYPDWEVVIVINDENMKEMLSGISGDVKIVEAQGENLSLLYNRGAEAASGEYLIFMKPGIVYFKDEGLLDAMKDSIAGIPLRNPDMTPYCLGIGFDFNFAPYFIKEEGQSDRTTEGTVPDLRTEQGVVVESGLSPSPDAVGGGLIGMHRGVFESIGGFDEGIANHLIEADICLSAKDKGYSVRYLPNCLGFVYRETFGQRAEGIEQSEDEWKTRIRFFAKWWGKLPKDDDYIKFAGDLLKV